MHFLLSRSLLSLRPATMVTTNAATTSSAALPRTAMIHRHLASSTSQAPPQIPSDQVDAAVIPKQYGPLATLTLNRPSSLNALNLDMIKVATPLIRSWEESPVTNVVLLRGKGRAFCAGGDVVAVTTAAQNPKYGASIVEFFKAEYEMDNFIAKMQTPVVAFMDGITMGGGVGLSVHAPFRVVTERTVFAMPETTIGLFPDVGASFFLSRLDGHIGLYLGLTSHRLNGWGALQAGIATHYVPSDQLEAIQDQLSQLEFSSNLSKTEKYDMVNNVLNEFSLDSPLQTSEKESPGYNLVGIKRQAIDSAFSHDSVEKIISSLRQMEQNPPQDALDIGQWAKEIADTIEFRSPTSCKVTLQAYKRGSRLNIDRVFDMELKLASRFCDINTTTDFVTGVKHLLIDKDKTTRPSWNPNTLKEVSRTAIAKTFFDFDSTITLDRSGQQNLQDKVFTQYPYRKYGLPSEEQIGAVVKGSAVGSGSVALTREEVIEKLLQDAKSKGGLRAKVNEVLDRKTTVGPEGVLKWTY